MFVTPEEVIMHNTLIVAGRPHRSLAHTRRTRRRRAAWLSLSALALAAATVGQVTDPDPTPQAVQIVRVDTSARGRQ